MDADWVKRKAMGEQFVENQKEDIWRSLCDSLEAAIDSYRRYYGGSAHGQFTTDHHYRILVNSRPPYQDAVIELTFTPPEVRVVCTMGHCKTSTFVLNPNKEEPFLNHDRAPMSIDQVSEAILHCILFPAERRGVRSHTIAPCA